MNRPPGAELCEVRCIHPDAVRQARALLAHEDTYRDLAALCCRIHHSAAKRSAGSVVTPRPLLFRWVETRSRIFFCLALIVEHSKTDPRGMPLATTCHCRLNGQEGGRHQGHIIHPGAWPSECAGRSAEVGTLQSGTSIAPSDRGVYSTFFLHLGPWEKSNGHALSIDH
jgi:hypothetical protein